ncbi:hypothetical protein Fmac_026538 [Flemingia macrophylla]|uniref:Uncharacterized protein n=1 Tax=Flemingia macrophylla TaxID=520843 RepID=A0ABD1LF57_9FABA
MLTETCLGGGLQFDTSEEELSQGVDEGVRDGEEVEADGRRVGVKDKVHLYSAKRFLKLCEANRGFYVKAGQFVASQKVLPREYSSTFSSLQD